MQITKKYCNNKDDEKDWQGECTSRVLTMIPAMKQFLLYTSRHAGQMNIYQSMAGACDTDVRIHTRHVNQLVSQFGT